MRNLQGLLQGIPLLRGKVLKESAEEIHLDNRVSLEIHAASFRGTRGYTLAAVVCDEIAFWRSDDSANPDLEIVNALRPGLATIPQALLIGISSPYARRGVLWEAYRRHWGKPSPDVLIWQAATRDMNPTVSAHVVERAHAEDPDAARAEYWAEFRRDIESFLSREAIAAAVVQGRESLAPRVDRDYYAFCDPSGGSGDAMALAIAHRDPERRDRAILDLVLERRPPFSPDAVVREFAHTLERYGLDEVTGDRYAAEWVRERFRVADVAYRPSELAKSDLYRELLPAMSSGRIELLDLPRLSAQLAALERRTARAGRDTVDHPPRGHDDMANAAAGALWLALRKRGVAETLRF